MGYCFSNIFSNFFVTIELEHFSYSLYEIIETILSDFGASQGLDVKCSP